MDWRMFNFITHTCQLVVNEIYTTSSKFGDIVVYEYCSFRDYMRNRKRKRQLKRKMKHSTTYSEWQEHALQYDDLKGHIISTKRIV